MYKLGREKEANRLLEEFIRDFPEESTSVAEICASIGDKDRAFEWLEKAHSSKDPTLTEGLYYPDFRILYKDPRWTDFINRIGLPEGHGVPLG